MLVHQPEVRLGGALGRKRYDVGLQEQPHLEDVARRAVVVQKRREGLHDGLHRILRDEGPRAGADHHQPLHVQESHRLSDRGAAHAQHLRQLPLGWQSITRIQLAIPDELVDLPYDLLGDASLLYGFEQLRPPCGMSIRWSDQNGRYHPAPRLSNRPAANSPRAHAEALNRTGLVSPLT